MINLYPNLASYVESNKDGYWAEKALKCLSDHSLMRTIIETPIDGVSTYPLLNHHTSLSILQIANLDVFIRL